MSLKPEAKARCCGTCNIQVDAQTIANITELAPTSPKDELLGRRLNRIDAVATSTIMGTPTAQIVSRAWASWYGAKD